MASASARISCPLRPYTFTRKAAGEKPSPSRGAEPQRRVTAHDPPYVHMRTLSPRSRNTQGRGSSGPWLGAAPPFSLSAPFPTKTPSSPPLSPSPLSPPLFSSLSPQALLSAPDPIDPAQRTQTTPTTTTVLDASFAQTHSFSLRYRLKYLPLPPAAARRRSTSLKETRDTPRSAAPPPPSADPPLQEKKI